MRQRTLVELPADLAEGIDSLVGVRNRSSFTADVVRRELKRRRQQAALSAASGTWKDANHPELAQGAASYIDKIRTDEARLEDGRLKVRSASQSR